MGYGYTYTWNALCVRFHVWLDCAAHLTHTGPTFPQGEKVFNPIRDFTTAIWPVFSEQTANMTVEARQPSFFFFPGSWVSQQQTEGKARQTRSRPEQGWRILPWPRDTRVGTKSDAVCTLHCLFNKKNWKIQSASRQLRLSLTGALKYVLTRGGKIY